MAKTRTNVHSTEGRITGKTVTRSYDDGSKKVTNYKNMGSTVFGPSYKATSSTRVDKEGNTRTKKY